MRTHRRGLTLIELMVTTVLAGLIMSSLMHVVTMTGRTRKTMAETPLHDQAWRDQLARQLRNDLTGALTVTWADNALRLEGWSGWERRTGEPIHEPARVVYRLLPIGPDQTALVREQRDLLDLGQQRPASTLMAIGVESLTLEPITNETLDADETIDTPGTPERLGAPGAGWSLVVTFDAGHRVLLPIPGEDLNREEARP